MINEILIDKTTWKRLIGGFLEPHVKITDRLEILEILYSENNQLELVMILCICLNQRLNRVSQVFQNSGFQYPQYTQELVRFKKYVLFIYIHVYILTANQDLPMSKYTANLKHKSSSMLCLLHQRYKNLQ